MGITQCPVLEIYDIVTLIPKMRVIYLRVSSALGWAIQARAKVLWPPLSMQTSQVVFTGHMQDSLSVVGRVPLIQTSET